MGQFILGKTEEINADHLLEIFRISTKAKIIQSRVERNNYMVMYDMNQFHGGNKRINFIPDRIFIEKPNSILFSDPIEIKLEYFPETLMLVQHFFPNIYKFINDNKIKSIKIKPSYKLTTESRTRIEVGVNDVKMIVESMIDPENSALFDSLIIIELIRKFYIGEMDRIDGLLIYKNNLKYIKALFEAKFTAKDLFDKLESSPTSIDITPFFKGSHKNKYMNILGNTLLSTTNASYYYDSLDLKFAGLAQVVMELLHKRRFGKEE